MDVVQMDREAAADLLASDFGGLTSDELAGQVRAGEHDDHRFVQSFARFRLKLLSLLPHREGQ